MEKIVDKNMTKEAEDLVDSTMSKLDTAKSRFAIAGKIYEMEQKVCTVWDEREFGPRPRHPDGSFVSSAEIIEQGKVAVSESLVDLISKAMEIDDGDIESISGISKAKAMKAFMNFAGRFDK